MACSPACATSACSKPAALRPPALLELHQAVGERQGQRLWGPLNLALHAGQAWHVRGANGSGKTTLLRSLAGLREVGAGSIARHAALWFVGHNTSLADELGAAANLRLFFQLAGCTVAENAPAAWLARWQLPAQRALRQLSAGQRRKLALAPLALAPRPLWLLDEPLDALDTAGTTWLAQAASAHLASGGALVLSSHQALPPGFPACSVLTLGQAPSAVPRPAPSPGHPPTHHQTLLASGAPNATPPHEHQHSGSS
jgi:heme exporter protein A